MERFRINSHTSDLWLRRLPHAGETCLFSAGDDQADRHTTADSIAKWKRDALLFDRIYARCDDPHNPPDIPLELSFGVAAIDGKTARKLEENNNSGAQMISRAYAGMSMDDVEKALADEGNLDLFLDGLNFEVQLSQAYSEVGVMGQWRYSSNKLYVRRFSKGERTAYEGALNNLPLVSMAGVPWEQIISFREDGEASR